MGTNRSRCFLTLTLILTVAPPCTWQDGSATSKKLRIRNTIQYNSFHTHTGTTSITGSTFAIASHVALFHFRTSHDILCSNMNIKNTLQKGKLPPAPFCAWPISTQLLARSMCALPPSFSIMPPLFTHDRNIPRTTCCPSFHGLSDS